MHTRRRDSYVRDDRWGNDWMEGRGGGHSGMGAGSDGLESAGDGGSNCRAGVGPVLLGSIAHGSPEDPLGGERRRRSNFFFSNR